ncbi:hypothetical protein [Ruminococcus flavefaciens]|uniref:Uncharacterized protein n=1 Tax=Ruminococcus flavefaciens TaxID=1265 RepID=A0A1K1NBF0_RUMFL|nr:hypothetical protein [Ruminococcus flavefaciens]SFW32636.1 hypothetical protein SAMN02910280_1789 [Ruminococcus flavefaciens]
MTDVEKLKEIIDEIDVLIEHNVKGSTPEFKVWHDKAKRFVYHHFGSDSPEYDNFSKIRFTLGVSTIGTPDYSYIEKCKRDLITAKGIFQNYLSELLEDGSDKSDVSDTEKDLERIFARFRKVAVQLARRYDGRETLRITDEYDVQDLLHSLLSLYYDDIRPEEWTPSYAGSSVRIDFVIPEIKTVIEVKKTRDSMTDKKLSEELIIDIEKYQKHPDCEKIYCFVYDPDTILRNPAAIKKDLEEKHQGLVRVFIES